MRRYLIAANWKMNGNKALNKALIQGIRSRLDTVHSVDIVVCVPFAYLQQVAGLLDGSPLLLAAQNVSEYEQGACTGEISAAMLADFSCMYALVGHSERRQLFAENNQTIAKKFFLLQAHNIQPILCVGETLEQREAGQTEAVVLDQLQAVIDEAGVAALKNCVLAYEPVWAIGTGLTASPEQAQAVHQTLRSYIADRDAKVAASLRIIYGGSVNEKNAQALFEQEDIDGGLIGGASLRAESFIEICKVV